jgi:sugar lactone lactonase YvrE
MTTVRTVADGFSFLECPRWRGGRLWLSDFYSRRVIAVHESGRVETIAEVAGQPSGLGWLPDGRLLVVPKDPAPDRRLLRREADGTMVAHADTSALPAGCNELVVDGRGNAYVNGVGFEFLEFIKNADLADPRPLPERPGYRPGFIALIRPDGTVRVFEHDLAFPNGMAITPDGRTLIVSESFAGRLTAFDVGDDGDLTNRRTFAEGLGPDGICLDTDGAVWTSSGGDAAVRVAEGGAILDRVELDRSPFALMLGGDDGRTLFIMAARWNPQNPFGGERTGQVLTARAPAPHAGRP